LEARLPYFGSLGKLPGGRLYGNTAVLVAVFCGACGAHGAAARGNGSTPAVVDVPVAAAVGVDARPLARAVSRCAERALILHAEHEQDSLQTSAGFSGHVYTYADSYGSHIVPFPPNLPGGGFSMSPGGVRSPYAAHMIGELVQGDAVFAGMGANFFDPKRPFDASSFQRVEFWARVGRDSNRRVRFSLTDRNTDPDGGVCGECFNDFGVELELETEWTRHELELGRFAQLPGWGSPRPARLDTAALFGFQLRVVDGGTSFDVWLDELAFSGCAATQN
jgi:endoglucanase